MYNSRPIPHVAKKLDWELNLGITRSNFNQFFHCYKQNDIGKRSCMAIFIEQLFIYLYKNFTNYIGNTTKLLSYSHTQLHLQNDLYCVGWGDKLYSLTCHTHWRRSCGGHFLAVVHVVLGGPCTRTPPLFPQVERLIRLVLLCTASSCTAERSFGALYNGSNMAAYSMMTQPRLNIRQLSVTYTKTSWTALTLEN